MMRKLFKMMRWLVVLLLIAAGAVTILFYRYTNPDIKPLLQELSALRKPGLDRIILCIDGVSWSYIRDLQAHGYFRIFRPASKVVVTYPAMTNVSLSDIWRTTPTPGYESLYFDRDSNAYGGGATTYIGKRKPEGRDYHTLMDYEEPRQYEFLVYVSPLRIIAADIRRSILSLAETGKREVRQYIKSSDGMIHIRGRGGAETFVRNLDAFLNAVFQANRGQVEIVMFSDHGNEFVPARRVPIDDALMASGYRIESRLNGPRSVVIPAFGLVSFAALYAHEGERPAIARLLAGQTGVDFVLYRQGDAIRLEAPGGGATLQWQGAGEAFRYDIDDADPLQLRQVTLRLQEAGKLDAQGFASSKDWFDATANSEYPDAPYRVWKGLTSQVEYPADLLVSFKSGYFFGSRTFDRFFSIEATHGSLRPDSSEAFLMSTHRNYPAALRGEELIRYFGTMVAFEAHSMHQHGACDH
jgi:hypothetical protein